MKAASRLALFDDTHGQPNWSQTGFLSRELDSNCSGLAEVLRGMGYDCTSVRPRLLSDRLSGVRLLVLPPPTGYYNPPRQTWQPLASSLLTPAELRDILGWLLNGEGAELEAVPPGREPGLLALHSLLTEQWRDVAEIEATGRGEAVVAFVERLLRQTGVLKALARWMP